MGLSGNMFVYLENSWCITKELACCGVSWKLWIHLDVKLTTKPKFDGDNAEIVDIVEFMSDRSLGGDTKSKHMPDHG